MRSPPLGQRPRAEMATTAVEKVPSAVADREQVCNLPKGEARKGPLRTLYLPELEVMDLVQGGATETTGHRELC